VEIRSEKATGTEPRGRNFPGPAEGSFEWGLAIGKSFQSTNLKPVILKRTLKARIARPALSRSARSMPFDSFNRLYNKDIMKNLIRATPIVVCALVLITGAGCTKQMRKARHLGKGEKAFRAQHYDEAEIEYLNVLKAAPLNPTAIARLGLIYQEEGRLLGARRLLLKAAELTPEDLDVRSKLALNSLSIGDYKTATDQANFVLTKRPGDTEGLEVLAGTAVNSNSLQQVQAQLTKLQQSDRDRAAYHVAFGTLSLRRRDLTNAEVEFKKALEMDPKSSSALLALGNIYSARNDQAAAGQALKSAADLAPLRSAKRLKYFEYQIVNGKVEEAKQGLQELTKQAPDYLPAWSFLAQLAFGEKKYDESRSMLQRVLSKDPFNYDGLMLSGNLRVAQGDKAKAVADFNQMATLYPRSPQVQFQLARAHLLNNDIGKAMGCLDQAIAADPNFADAILLQANLNIRKGDANLAIQSLNALLQRQPELGPAYMLLGDAYLAKRDVDQALAVCRRMAQVFPKAPEVPMLIGALLVRQNKLPEARVSFEHTLELVPDYLPAIEQIVNLDIVEKKYDTATERLQKQIEKQPKLAEPWLLMARVHLAQANAAVEAENRKNLSAGKPQVRLTEVPAAQPEITQAENALQKAIEVNPNQRTAYLMLADVYVAAGKQQEALQRLNGLLAKTNDVMVLMQVGILHESLKDYAAAKQTYEKILATNPNFSAALNNLAYIYAERDPFKDLDKAYQTADRARQLLPNDPAAADTLGWILYKRGEYSRALGLLQESASKLPNEAEIQFHLGMTHYMLGHDGAARLALQQAVQSPKDFSEKSQAGLYLAILNIEPKTADSAAVAALQKQLTQVPEDPIALDRLGSIQERDGAFDKAAETYQTALKHNAQDSGLTLKLAELYAGRLNAPDKALALAKSAHELAPDDARISSLLGRLVLQNGDSKPADAKWAVSLLEDSARKLPNDPQVTYDLAWADYTVGRVADAQSLMQNVANLGTSFAKAEDAKRFLEAVAASLNPAEAAKFSGEAQKILGSDPNYLPALMVSAISQEGQGNYKAAGDFYNKILARYSLFVPAVRNLGLLCLTHINDDQRAYDLLSKSRESFPQDPDVSKGLGILTFRKGNYSRAAQLLQESTGVGKTDPETLYYLGMAQYQLKAKSESKANLQKALASNLTPKLAEDARRVLTEMK
jgi:tetratricopeptide (TPR) repeat protein